MMRIKCPHCGAGNRDAEQTSTCWQCGKGLWEPANRHTYALRDLPTLSATTSLKPDSMAHVRTVFRDVWIAALGALLALLLFIGVAILFLHHRAEQTNNLPAPVVEEMGK